MRRKRLAFDQLENRIVLTGCQAFGAIVAEVAQGNAADYPFIEVGDGPASDSASDVGNLKSDIGSDGDPETHGVKERILGSHAFLCGD